MKNPFKQNVGLPDRILRVFVGIALLTLGTLTAWGTVGIMFILLSIPLLFSGITGFCPTYTLLGISTASPVSQGMSQMLHACCSTGGKVPSCPPMMKDVMKRADDCPAPREATTEPEGRGR